MTRSTETRDRRIERAALVSLVTKSSRQTDPDTLLDELAGLAHAAGADVALRCVQERDKPDAATLIGSGKAAALAVACAEADVTLDPLSAPDRRRLRTVHPGAILMSARSGKGRNALLSAIVARLELQAERLTLELDERVEADRKLVADLYRHGRVIRHETSGDRVSIDADVPRRFTGRVSRVKVPA